MQYCHIAFVKYVVRAGVLSIFLLATQLIAEEEWPNLRGVNFDGAAQQQVIQPGKTYRLKTVWKQATGSGYSSVSVANGMAVVLFSGETFDYAAAFDAQSGELRWKQPLDSIYKGHDGSHDGPIATPYVSKKQVFALSPWGKLAAFDLQTGREMWSTQIRTDHAAEKPLYGFSSSPFLFNSTVILEVNGQENNAIMGFDAETGAVRWSALKDTVMHQSPMMTEIDGQMQLIGITRKHIYGMNPESGEVLWQYKHDGDGYAISSGSMIPVPAGENRLFLTHKARESKMVRYQKNAETMQFTDLWESNTIRMTYAIPVYHDGYLFGYSNRFLTCIDAETGESVWKSREPGDGFISMLDGHLVLMTKIGGLHIAKATPEGYNELTAMKVFDNHAWTAPSFAYGKIYVRSHGELACLELAEAESEVTIAQTNGIIESSLIDKLVKNVGQSSEKSRLVDEFMASQTQFPIIEGKETIHFIYRGSANDISIICDYFGDRHEEPMHQIAGTNLFYYSLKLPSDARLDYSYMLNFENRVADSLNQRQFDGASWFAMPDWREAALPQIADDQRGTLDSLQLESAVTETERNLKIYLPNGYAESGQRYPVAYINWGDEVLAKTDVTNMLDRMTGTQIDPLIVVFIPLVPGRRGELLGPNAEKYSQMVTEEVVTLIDNTYRTIPESDARLIVGQGDAAHSAYYTAFKFPGVFGNVASQSMMALTRHENELREIIKASNVSNMRVYMDWGNFDMRSTVEGWDMRTACTDLAEFLKSRGYSVNTQTVNDGYSWLSWRNRTAQLLATFFPKK